VLVLVAEGAMMELTEVLEFSIFFFDVTQPREDIDLGIEDEMGRPNQSPC
jgi:hypothetical protein